MNISDNNNKQAMKSPFFQKDNADGMNDDEK